MSVIRFVADLQREIGGFLGLAKEAKEYTCLILNDVERLASFSFSAFLNLFKGATKAEVK